MAQLPGCPRFNFSRRSAHNGILGWTPTNTTTPTPPVNFTIVDTTDNTTTTVAEETYAGLVSSLQFQYSNLSTDRLNSTPPVPNAIIHSGSGLDGISVTKINGNNILGGPTGSNFLISGSGTDTFYMDDRNPASPLFSTIVGFHHGDSVTVPSMNANDFKLTTLDNQDATGALELNYIFTAP